jgi:hypothetical protein
MMIAIMSGARWMLLLPALALASCATPSGLPVARIAEPDIAAAYIPLFKSANLGLSKDAGAATILSPGIAVTNAHNANLIDPKAVIGQVGDYDLLYFRTARSAAPATAEPVIGSAVTAYGADTDGRLRIAHGVVRAITGCPGCKEAAYFTFAGDAGPGFSGGPVVDVQGRLIGIVFGYKDGGRERLIYAYDMARVRAEFSALPAPLPKRVN